ncbi:MAG: hypothetical protein SNG27_08665 [Rikenellaceae bacterium]
MSRLKLWILTLVVVVGVHFGGVASEVKVVNSLAELLPYLSQSDVNVKLAPGLYRHTLNDARSKPFNKSKIDVTKGKFTYALLLIAGNNSTYDFEGVTIEVETSVFNAYEGSEFVELHTVGSNNVVKGLKLQDVGGLYDFPQWGCVNIVADGANNRIEGVEVRSVGSYPYGYGEVFGKGGPATIRHKKHSACLVRGYANHIKDCKIYHRAYGHCLFMQAADKPFIDGCYIEGEMGSTDAVLRERGSGSAADKINFKTVWGYPVPEGHAIALCEEGIRAYNGGSTIVDGERFSRGTSNVTIKDCYVKNARAGVTLTHAKGTRYVENTTAVGCNRGFAVGTGGRIVNCFADTKNGPAFGVDYESDRGIVADITILPYEGEHYNGSTHMAIIIGQNHKITFKKGDGLRCAEDLYIHIGGDNKTIGMLKDDNNYKATGINIINETGYTMVLDDNASNISGSTAGKLIDEGVNNSVETK